MPEGFAFAPPRSNDLTSLKRLSETDGPQPHREQTVARAIANGRWRWLTAGLAAGALLAAAVASVLVPRTGAPDGVGRSLPQRRFEVSGPADITIDGLAISPDGSRIAYHSGGKLYIRSLDALEPFVATDAPSHRYPFFSPDGSRIAFFRQRAEGGYFPFDLDVVDLVERNRSTLCAACGPYSSPGRGGDWADDGSIVFSMRGGLWRISEDGGVPEPLLPAVDGQSYVWPKVLPGSRAVVFAIHRGNQNIAGAQIAVMPLPSGPVRALVEDATSPEYTATGHLLFAREGNVLAAPFDVERLELLGEPVIVLRDIMTSEIAGPAQYAVSDDGSVLIQRGGVWNRNVFQPVRIDAEGTVTDLDVEPGGYRNPQVSPDGQLLAMQRMLRGDNDLWLVHLTTDSLEQLTAGPADDRWPVFSPDGTRIAFASDREGTLGIYQLPVDRSGEPELLLATERWVELGSWSPDGRTLTFEHRERERR